MIERLKELEKKATKGPWRADSNNDNIICGSQDLHYASLLFKQVAGTKGWQHNIPLIVALRNAAPLLLAVAEALEPFAEEAAEWEHCQDDSVPLVGHRMDVRCNTCEDDNIEGLDDAKFTVGDLRKLLVAYRALKELKP